MKSVDVQRADGRPLAQFAILPMQGVNDDTALSQLGTFQKLTGSKEARFFFLVTPETIRGWSLSQQKNTGPWAPVFREPAPAMLGIYTNAKSPGEVGKARENYLAGLVDAWVADLSTHWRSRSGEAPGEAKLRSIGLVDALREAQSFSP